MHESTKTVKKAQVHQAVKNILHNEMGFDRNTISHKIEAYLGEYLDHKFFGARLEQYFESDRFNNIVRGKLDAKIKMLTESAQKELHDEVVKIVKSKIKIKGIEIEIKN